MDGQLRRCDPQAAFRRPLWWGALAVLVMNDHWLKGSGLLPGVLTGKLSDFAGLIVAPAILASFLGVTRTRAFAGCALLIACVFASMKTSPPIAEAIEALSSRLGVPCRVWCDPTDLIALPALLLGLRCGGALRRSTDAPNARSRWALAIHYVAVIAGSLACVATSMPEPHSPRSIQADDARRVYVSFWGGLVRVVDAPSGGLLRTIEMERERSSDWAVDGSRIYGAGTDGVVAHDVSSGKRLFRTNIDCPSCRAHVVPGGARVFVFVRHQGDFDLTGAAEWVFALDHDSGKVEWFRKLESPSPEDERGVRPVFANQTLVVPTERGLLGVSPETGAMRWISRVKAPRWPGIVDHLVYFGSEHEIIEVAFGGGSELWRLRLENEKPSSYRARPKLGVGGNRIVYSHAGRLTALDRVSKQRVWQTECSELLNVGGEIVLALLEDGTLVALDVADGRRLWQVREPGGFAAPVFSEGLVVVRTALDVARAYDARTGAERWALELRPAP